MRIFEDVAAGQALGIHWGTFQLTDEAVDAPQKALAEALVTHGIDPNRFQALRPGQSIDVPPLRASRAGDEDVAGPAGS